jgi:hypothetical protein
MVQNFFAHRCSSEGSAQPRQIGETRDYLPTHFEAGLKKSLDLPMKLTFWFRDHHPNCRKRAKQLLTIHDTMAGSRRGKSSTAGPG